MDVSSDERSNHLASRCGSDNNQSISGHGVAVTNGRRSAWQMSQLALRPDIAQTGTMPPGSTHRPHMVKSVGRSKG